MPHLPSAPSTLAASASRSTLLTQRPHLGAAHAWLRRLILAVAACALLGTLGACHNYYGAGLEAFQAGRFDEAAREARAGLREDKRDPQLNLLMAQALAKQEQWAEARQFAARAVGMLPELAEAHRVHGLVQARSGAKAEGAWHLLRARELDPALSDAVNDELRRALPPAIADSDEASTHDRTVAFILALRALKPGHPDASDQALKAAQEAHGEQLVSVGKYAEAAAHYQALAEQHPGPPSYAAERGVLLLLMGDDAAASAAIDAYVQQGASPADTTSRMVDVAERAQARGRLDTALKLLRDAVALSPKDPRAQLALGRALLLDANPKDAFVHLQAHVEAQPSAPDRPKAAIEAARVASDSGFGNVAIELLARANAEQPPYFGVADMLGDLLLRRDRVGELRETFERFIERSPAAARQQAALDVATWLERNRQYDVAIAILNKALAQDAPAALWLRQARLFAAAGKDADVPPLTDNYLRRSEQAPRDYLTAADLLARSGLYDAAERTLQDALKRHKADPTLLRTLATVQRDAGFLDREEATLRAWVATQPDKPRASLEIGRLYARLAEGDRAMPFLRDAAKSPDLAPDAWLAIGEAFQNQGKDREMREAFDQHLALSPDKTRALENILNRYGDPNRAEDALRVLEQLVKLNPDRSELHIDIARKLIVLGDMSRAFDRLRDFVRTAPSPSRATRVAGRLLISYNAPDLALDLYQSLLAQKPSDNDTYLDVGDLYTEVAQYFNRVDPRRADPLFDSARAFYTQYVQGVSAQNAAANNDLARFASRMTERDMHGLAVMAFDKAAQIKAPIPTTAHFNHGRSLLALGRFDDAHAAFKRHISSTRAQEARLFAVAKAAYDAGAFKLSLIYLDAVLDKNVQAFNASAFDLASQIYLKTGQRDRVEPLALRYLALTSASWSVRLKVADTYAEAGLWDKASAEYRDMLRVRPDNPNMTRRLAQVVYLSGDPAEAKRLFQSAAANASDPARTWETVGAFYLDHGEPDAAIDALSQAIDAGQNSPSTAQALARRGAILALRGDLDAALKDWERALAADGDLQERYQTITDALARTGHRDLLVRFAREAADRVKNPTPFLAHLASAQLARGDFARGLPNARAWGKAQNDPRPWLALLDRHHAPLEALDVLRNQIETGDSNLVEQLVFNEPDNTALILAQIGAQRLPSVYRPLFQRRNDPSPLHRDVGTLYARLQDRGQAILNLSAASAKAPQDSDLLLGQLYLFDGDARQARGAFSRYLSLYDDNPANLQLATRAVAWAYLSAGDTPGAERFLRAVAARPNGEALMAPLLTEVLLIQGRRADALDLLRSGPFAPLFAPSNANTPTPGARLSDLIQSARVLAGYGYGDAATRLLADLAAQRDDHPGLMLALVELGARYNHPNTDAFADRFLALADASGDEPASARLRLADAFASGDAYPKARALIDALLKSPHPATARLALRRAVNVAVRTNDSKALDAALDLHTRAQADRFQAYLDQSRILRNVGLFRRAASRVEAAVKLIPGRSDIANTFRDLTALAGNPEATFKAHQRALRVNSTDALDALPFASQLTAGPDPSTASTVWRDLRDDLPALSDANTQGALAAYLAGNPDDARALLQRWVASTQNDPVALERALTAMAQAGAYDDAIALADSAAPPKATTSTDAAAAPPAAPKRGVLPPRTPNASFLLGVAHYATGKRDAAMRHFDAFTRDAQSPLMAELRVCRALHALANANAASDPLPTTLARLKLDPATVKDAITFAERAIERSPESPQAYLLRGLMRLHLGQTQPAIDDFNLYLQRGAYDTPQGLALLSTALLSRGATQQAEPFLLRLAHNPAPNPSASDDGGPGSQISSALRAFADAGQPQAGLDFLARHFPALAAAPHLDLDALFHIARLHADAGHPDRALSLFHQASRRYPDNGRLLNNFAYTLTRPNGDLKRAEAIARRALTSGALSPSTLAQYLDTLAWIYHSQGDPKRAVNELRAALRLPIDDPRAAALITHHLAEALQASGDANAAKRARARARATHPDLNPVPLRP